MEENKFQNIWIWLTCVCSDMTLEVEGIIEAFTAARAVMFFKWCMWLQMSIQKAWMWVRFLADITTIYCRVFRVVFPCGTCWWRRLWVTACTTKGALCSHITWQWWRGLTPTRQPIHCHQRPIESGNIKVVKRFAYFAFGDTFAWYCMWCMIGVFWKCCICCSGNWWMEWRQTCWTWDAGWKPRFRTGVMAAPRCTWNMTAVEVENGREILLFVEWKADWFAVSHF